MSLHLISRVTDADLDEVRQWQNRPLDPAYPVVFFDALRVKIRDEGWSRKRPSMSSWRRPIPGAADNKRWEVGEGLGEVAHQQVTPTLQAVLKVEFA